MSRVNYSANSNAGLLLFLGTAAACFYGESALIALKSQVKSYFRTKADQEIIILSPPPSDNPPSKKEVLLIIFPGAFLKPPEYVAIAKVAQEQAASCGIQLTVGIGLLLYTSSSLTQWAFDNDDNDSSMAKRIQQKAASAASSVTTKQFHHTFVWGHSLGGNKAIQTAYPSSITGLIMYGVSWSLVSTKQPQNLISFPRPSLTIVGDRDGFMRPLLLAEETRYQQQDMDRRIMATSGSSLATTGKEENNGASLLIQRQTLLKKPIVILPALNHLHMSLGIIHALTRRSGRCDGYSPLSLEEAHSRLGQVVVDFMHIHCTDTTTATMPQENNNNNNNSNNNNAAEESEQRLLQLVHNTRTYLRPFMELTDPLYTSRFVQDCQSKLLLLHLPLPVSSLVTVVVEWRPNPKDFLYSKPNFSPRENHLWVQVTEQDHLTIQICNVAQISKTVAIKSKLPDAIRMAFATGNSNSKHYPEGIADDGSHEQSRPQSIMQINQQTFDKVLNELVTPNERQRYLNHGKQLHFGPDVLVEMAPKWVETPLIVTKGNEELNVAAGGKDEETTTPIVEYYILQSPYTTTPASMPPPFGGIFYFKPLSPSQAYEWIVFDCFK
jgi:hypothetical protein